MCNATLQFNRISHRRGTVVIAVLWAIAIAAIVVASLQLFGFRQAALGRDGLQKVQSRWAARSGIEYSIAVMAEHTQQPYPGDAFALARDLQYVASGETGHAEWDIRHYRDGRVYAGPRDEHAMLNVNQENVGGMLMVIPHMTLDVADAINDWKDADNDPGALGIERDYYRNLETPLEPRNGRVRSTAELELVAGVWPTYMRGEDWNLNGSMDPNENDEARTFPPDEADDHLDMGWSEYLTAYSRHNGATESGLPRLQLKRALPEELVERIGITEEQAYALISFGRNEDNILENLFQTPLSLIDARGNTNEAQVNPGVESLTAAQLSRVLAETCMEHPAEWHPGRININTIPEQFLRDLLFGEETLADEIIYLRDSSPEGIGSMTQLLDVPEMTPTRWQQLTSVFDVRSNVFTIASTGRSKATGVEIEIIAVVDRSTVPIRIIEYREQ